MRRPARGTAGGSVSTGVTGQRASRRAQAWRRAGAVCQASSSARERRRAPARARRPGRSPRRRAARPRRGGSDLSRPSRSATSARRASAFILRVASAARFWAEVSATSSSAIADSWAAIRDSHRLGERGVLGGAGDGEVAVGLRLLGPVAGGLAAGLHQLGVGDAGGGGAEHDAEPRQRARGASHEPLRTAPSDEQRRDHEECDSDGEPDAPLPATGLGGPTGVRGRHEQQVMSSSSSERTRHARSRSSAVMVIATPAIAAASERHDPLGRPARRPRRARTRRTRRSRRPPARPRGAGAGQHQPVHRPVRLEPLAADVHGAPGDPRGGADDRGRRGTAPAAGPR